MASEKTSSRASSIGSASFALPPQGEERDDFDANNVSSGFEMTNPFYSGDSSVQSGGVPKKKANLLPAGAKNSSSNSSSSSPRNRRGSAMVIATSSSSSGSGKQTSKVIKKHASSHSFMFQPVPRKAVMAARKTLRQDEDKDDDEDQGSSSFEEGEEGDIENSGDAAVPKGGGSPLAMRQNMKKAQSKKMMSALQTQPSDDGEIYAVFESEHRPYFIYSTIIICCFIMLLELYMNSFDRDLKVNPCPVQFWKFCFESPSENPFFGPSSTTLLKMGAKTGKTIVIDEQFKRLFTCMYLHGGVLHLGFNMMALLSMGKGIEESYGTVKVGLIYIMAGLFGSIMSTIFTPEQVGVGASGAIFGLFGAGWGDLIQNWDLYDSPLGTLISLAIGTLFNLGIGTAPLLDNFAHFFGFVMGMIMSLGLLVVERQTSSGRHVDMRCWHIALEFLPVIMVPFSMVIGLGVLYSGVSGHEVCSSCTSINCIPFPWGCDVHIPGECMWDCSTCGSVEGLEADLQEGGTAYNSTVILRCPLLSDWTKTEIETITLKEQDVTNFDLVNWLIPKCKVHCTDAFI
ncbi:hypothetical protein TrVE_jg5673 [Triparma verrucosa]|uniref:rhomboid protease n=1 Tax=Triparma verrucosa TaxID=1606542 RepID=A0A9W7BKW0_9STRA|nr:hypothetical protein TrVE_jg5673 [Triparma verrucosa]